MAVCYVAAGRSPLLKDDTSTVAYGRPWEVPLTNWYLRDLPWPEDVPAAVALPFPVGVSTSGWLLCVPSRLYSPAIMLCPRGDSVGVVPSVVVGLYVLAVLYRHGVSVAEALAVRDVDPASEYPGALAPLVPQSVWWLVGILRSPTRTQGERLAAAASLVAVYPQWS